MAKRKRGTGKTTGKQKGMGRGRNKASDKPSDKSSDKEEERVEDEESSRKEEGNGTGKTPGKPEKKHRRNEREERVNIVTVDESNKDSDVSEVGDENCEDPWQLPSESTGKFIAEELEELQRVHGHEKNVHFFEYVMARVLGARLDRAMNLEKFVNFIAGPSLFPSVTHFNSFLDLCGRKMECVVVHEQTKRNNVFCLYRVKDGPVQMNVFEKKTSSDKETVFLNWAKNRVRYGDLNAVPLLLNDVEPMQPGGEGAEISLFIPDYGATLNSFLKNCSTVFDKELLGLSLLSTICSISCVNKDLHDRNICVFRPDLIFVYKWTIRISCHMFEICWNSKGMLATIDWEYRTLFPRISSFVSSGSSSSFSPILWETQIGNFASYGLTLTGQFTGQYGMAVILFHVLSSFNNSLFKLRYRKLAEYGSSIGVSSLLEVFPTAESKPCSFDSVQKARWNQFMSSRGKIFKTQKFLTQHDINSIRDLYQSFTCFIKMPFYEIPSDTGKVVLMKDGKLVAADFIEKDQLITYVPLTKCETFSNPRVWIGSVQGTILKKAWPFCGFGGFAQWGSKAEANCMMKSISSFIALFATKPIPTNNPIICENNILQRRTATDIEDSTSIKSIVEQICKSSPQTRDDISKATSQAEDELQ